MPLTPIRPDLSIAWRAVGPERAPPLLLVGGLGAPKETWFRQVRAFSGRWRVVIADPRGIGGSSRPEGPFSIPDLAEDLVRLLDAIGIGQVHVWGASMGGMVAMELALGWPERIGRLVLASTHAGLSRCRGAGGPSALRDAGETSVGAILEGIVPLLFGPEFRAEKRRFVEAFARARLRNPPDPTVIERQWAAHDAYEAWDRLGAIRSPTLVLVAERDVLVDPANGPLLAARIPGSVLSTVPCAGHAAHLERPDEVNARVERFLLGADPAGGGRS